MDGSRWHRKNASWSRWSRVASAMARTLSLLPEDKQGESSLDLDVANLEKVVKKRRKEGKRVTSLF